MWKAGMCAPQTTESDCFSILLTRRAHSQSRPMGERGRSRHPKEFAIGVSHGTRRCDSVPFIDIALPHPSPSPPTSSLRRLPALCGSFCACSRARFAAATSPRRLRRRIYCLARPRNAADTQGRSGRTGFEDRAGRALGSRMRGLGNARRAGDSAGGWCECAPRGGRRMGPWRLGRLYRGGRARHAACVGLVGSRLRVCISPSVPSLSPSLLPDSTRSPTERQVNEATSARGAMPFLLRRTAFLASSLVKQQSS